MNINPAKELEKNPIMRRPQAQIKTEWMTAAARKMAGLPAMTADCGPPGAGWRSHTWRGRQSMPGARLDCSPA
ncbi:MAG: hypothetical protein ACUVR2_12160 [Anaerolineae bacterium]